jgi:isoleucyl-tRNA synthetase
VLLLCLVVNADLCALSIVVVAFLLVDDPKTSLLAWTTTPWTLPSNLALCVHPDYNYIKIYDEERDQNYILLESRLVAVYKDPKKAKIKKVGLFSGEDMRGWRYTPMFEYFTEKVRNLSSLGSLLTSWSLPSMRIERSA